MPKQCYANARQCIELAADVKYPKLRRTFLTLAEKWTELALSLEDAGKRPRRPATRKRPKGASVG
jgi:hypothetical protein